MFHGERLCPGRKHEETGRVKDWIRGNSWEAKSEDHGASKREVSAMGQPHAVMNKSSQLNPLIAKGS